MNDLAKILKDMQKEGSPDATDMVYGVVTVKEPIEIRIGDKLFIDSTFIELSNSLAANNVMDVDDVVRLIKYSKGQKYFALEVVGKIDDSGNYESLTNLPILNTNNSASQAVSSSEVIKGTIKMHKIAKTGKYSDLVGLPNLDEYIKKTGGTMTGALILQGTTSQSNAKTHGLMTRGIQGSDGLNELGDLYLNYGNTNAVKINGENRVLDTRDTIVQFLGGTIVDY